LPTLNNDELIAQARIAQGKAYAPYSCYMVGAAILSASGRVYLGANIENMSYGATMCAERAAIAQMVMGGDHEIEAIAVVTPDDGYPCGICLQSINEFSLDAESVKIVVPSSKGTVSRTLKELAPYLWSSEHVQPKNLS
jgi:cytidine deaminase